MSQKLENARGLYMDGIRDGHVRQAITRYTGARYTQHSTGVRDGVEGFIEFFEPFLARNPQRDIQIIRAWEDGQYVFVHAYQSLNAGAAEWVTTDFFDTDENDKIIEHWDVISPYGAQTPSGHTTVYGATEISDLASTEANKQLVRDFIRDVLIGENPQKIDDYISSETFIQHNVETADGLDVLKSLILAEERVLTYDAIVLLVGQGNFVAALCKAARQGEPYAQVDIFRMADGKIVEHWDNAEKVPPPEESVNSGKFGVGR